MENLIDLAAKAIEVLAVAIIVIAIIHGSVPARSWERNEQLNE
jgi:hypothetical protein